MRLVTFHTGYGLRIGAVMDGDEYVLDLHRACKAHHVELGHGKPWVMADALCPTSMVEFLQGGEEAMDLARRLLAEFTSHIGSPRALKEVVERPRPSPALVSVDQQPGDFSFPSGHANTALVLYGLIIYLAAVYVPNPWLRVPLQGFCLWVIIGNGLQRVYVGHHWPSDVLGGYYLGALVLAVLIAVERGVLRPLRPGQGRSFRRMKTGVGDGR